MKKFGDVLECHTEHHSAEMGDHDGEKSSDALKCEGSNSGRIIELKSGTRHNQHIVSIEPGENGKGSNFGLVYIRLRGKGHLIEAIAKRVGMEVSAVRQAIRRKAPYLIRRKGPPKKK